MTGTLERWDRVEFMTAKGKRERGKVKDVKDGKALVEFHSSYAVRWMPLEKLTKIERGSI
jgi:hypothetical protein